MLTDVLVTLLGTVGGKLLESHHMMVVEIEQARMRRAARA